MSLSITQRPEVTNAAFSPVVYKFQRKDYGWTTINNSGGFAQVQINGVDVTAFFDVGDTVYINSENGNYDDFTTVTARTFSGGNTLVTTALTFISTPGGGGISDFINNITQRPGHRVLINLLDESGDPITSYGFTYSSTSRGAITADVSGAVNKQLEKDYEIESGDDLGKSLTYKIGYTEQWSGSAESETEDTVEIISYYSAIQIGNPNSMDAYIMDSDENQFLTLFHELSLFDGQRFLLNFISTDSTPYLEEKRYLRDTLISTTSQSLACTPYSVSKVIVTADPLTEDEIRVRLYTDSGKTIPISREKIINVKTPCDNPVTLYWISSIGDIAQWTFDFNQEVTITYREGKRKRMVLSANNLTLNEWEVINGLNTIGATYKNSITEFTSLINKTHSRVGQQVYYFAAGITWDSTEITFDSTEWTFDSDHTKFGVIVVPTPQTTSTKFKKHSIEITIELPDIQLQ